MEMKQLRVLVVRQGGRDQGDPHPVSYHGLGGQEIGSLAYNVGDDILAF